MPQGIYQLKEEGHELIEELVAGGMRLMGHRGVYGILRRRLKVPEGKQHFGAMNKEWEVINAVNELKEMLLSKKKNKRHLSEKDRADHNITPVLPTQFLPRDQWGKAMQGLEEYKKQNGPFYIRVGKTLWKVGIMKLT